MKQKIKMIVSDLDGTLLRTDKTISGRSKAVLEKCRKVGIKVVYATARGGTASKLAPSQYFDARIRCNGALAFLGDVIIYEKLVPYKTVRSLLAGCNNRGLKATAEADDIHYSNFVVTDEWPIVTNFEIVDFSKFDKDAQKICIIYKNHDDIDFIKNYLTKELYLFLSRDNIAMIMHKEASKAMAISVIAKVWEIEQAEIAAFGDDVNDIDMLKSAGIGVAMGNAVEEVKAITDYVCLSNDQDGVVDWIERNIKISAN